MTRAVGYVRISRDSEGLRLGVERQRADVRALAERNGWDLVEIYEDNDITASKPMRREHFARMVAAVEAGQVDVVVAYSQSRLYRDTARFLAFLETCKTAGVESVALVADQAVNPSGSLFLTTVIAAKDAEESRVIGERVGRKHRELAENGMFHGGVRPFGYERNGVTLREQEAAAIREAAERVLAGQSLHSIATDWNRRGIRTSRDREWVGTTVKQMLLAPRLCGVRVHHGEVREAVWPAILPRDTWEAVKAVLAAPGRTWPTRTRSHPLRKILVCGECGRELYNGSSSHTRLYQCRSLRGGGCGRTFVRAEKVEEYVFGVLLPLLDSPTMRDAARAEDVATQDEVRRLVAENAADAARLAELADMLADGEMDRASYARASRRLRDRVEDRTARLSTVRGESVLDRLGGQVAEKWPTMTDEEKRTVLQAVVGNVTVAKGKGGGPFDPRRVKINFRTEAFARAAAGLGYAELSRFAEALGDVGDEDRSIAEAEAEWAEGGPVLHSAP